MDFIHFTEIDPAVPSTWEGKSILSLDLDWAIDEILEDTLDLILEAEIKATMFVTHETPVLDKMRESPLISLGVHPNFNPLLKGDPDANSPSEVFSDVMKIVPEAKVLRSHSMTHSGLWLDAYKEIGLTHLSQYYMGGLEVIQPIKHVNGLVEVPVYFADDGYLFVEDHGKWKNPSEMQILAVQPDSVKVYNFHPIHIALNSNSFTLYNSTRPDHRDWKAILGHRSFSFGMRDMFTRLIKLEPAS